MEGSPIQVMYKEHEIITQAEYNIKALFHTWIDKPEEYVSEVKRLISFFKEYADKMHHMKEENVLFPALRDCDEFTLDELLSELEAHHERFREYTGKILQDLSAGDYAEAWTILKEYCNDLLDHIAVENDELFVLAEALLSAQELERIYFKFQDVDREMGLDRKKELEDIVLNPTVIDSVAAREWES
jgi:hemerythrin-like domain-containing protein